MIRWRQFRWTGVRSGLALSVLLHGLILAGLLITLPQPEPETEPDEQVVEVTLVEPPEAPEAPELPPEPPEAEPEAEPEPVVPEPPQPEAEQPPEAEPVPEPPAPEPEEPEEAAAEPPEEDDPAPEKAPAPDAAGAGQAAPIPVLRPVFQFGEEDSGPRLAPDGDSAGDPVPPESNEAAASTPPNEAPEPVEASAEPVAPSPEPELTAPEIAEPETIETQPPGIALPEITLPEASLSESALAEPDPAAAPAELSEPLAEPPADTSAEANQSPDAPETEPPETEFAETEITETEPAETELAEAGELFSPVLTENRAAMVAMGSLARGLRASQLCTTELREQLRNDPRRYGVELLPSYQLDEGNVLAVGDAAFRADGAWYDLSFRCTVDDEALRVLGFAHKVGAPIPRNQWTARGFPSF